MKRQTIISISIFVFILSTAIGLTGLNLNNSTPYEQKINEYKKRWQRAQSRSREERRLLWQVNKEKLKEFQKAGKISTNEKSLRMDNNPEFMLIDLPIDNPDDFEDEIKERRIKNFKYNEKLRLQYIEDKKTEELESQLMHRKYPTDWFKGDTPEDRAVNKYKFIHSSITKGHLYALPEYISKMYYFRAAANEEHAYVYFNEKRDKLSNEDRYKSAKKYYTACEYYLKYAIKYCRDKKDRKVYYELLSKVQYRFLKTIKKKGY